MSIPSRLSMYLNQHGVKYEVCAHKYSSSSAETARSAHVLSNELAKSVMLEDEIGFVMAVVPANQSVMLGKLTHMLGRQHLRLSNESHIALRFQDCEPGAVPSLGMPWGVETIVDDELESCDTVYLECGDHERLLRVSGAQFHDLMSTQQHGHFSKPMTH